MGKNVTNERVEFTEKGMKRVSVTGIFKRGGRFRFSESDLFTPQALTQK